MSENTSKISNRELVFRRRLLRNHVHSEILAFFVSVAERDYLTKRDLAARLGKDPSAITRWFSEPSNLGLDTISDLLVGMGGEMEVRILRSEENYSVNDVMSDFLSWSDPETSSWNALANSPDNDTKIEFLSDHNWKAAAVAKG